MHGSRRSRCSDTVVQICSPSHRQGSTLGGCLLQACRDRSWASLAAPSATVVDLLQYQAMAGRYVVHLC